MVFQARIPGHYVFQSLQYGYGIFQNVNPALQNHIAKNI